MYSGAIVTHGISIFSVRYLRKHCAQDTAAWYSVQKSCVSQTPSIRTLRGKFEGLLPPGTRKTARNNEVSVLTKCP